MNEKTRNIFKKMKKKRWEVFECLFELVGFFAVLA
jgi:hypothetical protein